LHLIPVFQGHATAQTTLRDLSNAPPDQAFTRREHQESNHLFRPHQMSRTENSPADTPLQFVHGRFACTYPDCIFRAARDEALTADAWCRQRGQYTYTPGEELPRLRFHVQPKHLTGRVPKEQVICADKRRRTHRHFYPDLPSKY